MELRWQRNVETFLPWWINFLRNWVPRFRVSPSVHVVRNVCSNLGARVGYNRGIDMERQYLVNFLKDSVITAERPNMTPVGWPCEFWASRKNFPGQCCWLLRERCQGHTWDVGQAIHNYRRCCFWLIRGSLSSHLRQLARKKPLLYRKTKPCWRLLKYV